VARAPVSPGLVTPGVPIDAEPQATELPEHRGPLWLGVGRPRTGVRVDVVDVANLHVVPTAGTVHQPGRIGGLDPVRDVSSIVLAPALVERYPHHDAGMVMKMIEHALQLQLELAGGLGRARDLALAGADTLVTRWHVLPH